MNNKKLKVEPGLLDHKERLISSLSKREGSTNVGCKAFIGKSSEIIVQRAVAIGFDSFLK